MNPADIVYLYSPSQANCQVDFITWVYLSDNYATYSLLQYATTNLRPASEGEALPSSWSWSQAPQIRTIAVGALEPVASVSSTIPAFPYLELARALGEGLLVHALRWIWRRWQWSPAPPVVHTVAVQKSEN